MNDHYERVKKLLEQVRLRIAPVEAKHSLPPSPEKLPPKKCPYCRSENTTPIAIMAWKCQSCGKRFIPGEVHSAKQLEIFDREKVI